ncbi:MAG: DJ-1/PfpI family protein [Verrucomicrobiaceae bacterium]|nr:DJ-1/PfpI family protein [Verrucomicrobiaceae bacterium]
MNDITPATRRAFLKALTAASSLIGLREASAQSDAEKAHARAMELLKPGREKIAILIYPSFTALDAIGPQHMLAGMTGASVKFIAATAEPVKTDSGYLITPQLTFDQCPEHLDLLLIPGGTLGTIQAMEDNKVLDFVTQAANRSKRIGSVCTGSLILGAAGLLKGKRATSHWQTLDLLKIAGATPVAQRIVRDQNIITAAGVTAGIDLALDLVREYRGDFYAQGIQLLAEYDPQPHFPKSGNAATAPKEVVDLLNHMHAGFMNTWGEKLGKVVEERGGK